jgi:glutamate dehydrogenase/leucine dehydrogenase
MYVLFIGQLLKSQFYTLSLFPLTRYDLSTKLNKLNGWRLTADPSIGGPNLGGIRRHPFLTSDLVPEL